MKWLRLYHEILEDPKVQRLEPAMFKFWINFLCLANRQEVRGLVQKPAEVIAFELRITDDEAEHALSYLQSVGLIDHDETGFRPHNWDSRQRKSDDVTARVTAHREKSNVANQPEPTTKATKATLQNGETGQHDEDETLHATLHPSAREELEQELEQEPEEIPPQPPKGELSKRQETQFDAFWSAYPRKEGKGAVQNWWAKKKPPPELVDRMLEAIAGWKKSAQWQRDNGQYVPMPLTWLNQSRWDDEIPPPATARELNANGRASPGQSRAAPPGALTRDELIARARGEVPV